MLRLNDIEVDLFQVKQLAADPKWAERAKHAGDKFGNLLAMVSDPGFRIAQVMNLPAETFIKLSGVTSSGAAFNLVEQRGYPYFRLVLDRSGRDKFNIRIEYVL